MQERGWDDGRFVLIEQVSDKKDAKSAWAIHDMAQCGEMVRFFSTSTKGGHWRYPEAKAREVCAQMNAAEELYVRSS